MNRMQKVSDGNDVLEKGQYTSSGDSAFPQTPFPVVQNLSSLSNSAPINQNIVKPLKEGLQGQGLSFGYSGRKIINEVAQDDHIAPFSQARVISNTQTQSISQAPAQIIRRSYQTYSIPNLQNRQPPTQGLILSQEPSLVDPQLQKYYAPSPALIQREGASVANQRLSYQQLQTGQIVVASEVVRQGEPRIISESKMQSRLVEQKEGQPQLVDVKYGQSYEINRSTHVDANVRVKENRLEVREQRPSFTQANLNKDVTVKSERAVISQRVVEKPVDVYIEKPVPVYKEVEVPYDVIIEKPVEKIIERDVITEIIMEKPIEKILEIPVHKVIEIPIQKTIERPVFIDKYVDVPREVFKDTPKEVIVETPVFVEKVIEVDEKDIGKYKYDRVLPTEVKVFEKPVYKEQKRPQKNIIEKTVEVPVEKVIERKVPRVVERPIERVVEKPVYIDNVIEKVVQVPVENVVYNKVEQIIEEPEFVEQIIEKPVTVEKIVQRPVEQIQEVLVEKPVYVERLVEKEVPQVVEKEVKIEREVKVPVQRIVEKPVYKERVVTKEVPKIIEQEVIYETTVPVEKVNIVEEVIPVPIDRIIERPVEKTVEKFVDVFVEKEVFEDSIVEDIQYVEKIVQVPLERIVERPVFKENLIEKQVYIEKIVEKEVEVPVEKIVEVPVEKIVEVPVDIIVENPVPRQKVVQRDVYIDKKVAKPKASNIRSGAEDASARAQVQGLERQVSETKIAISKLKAEHELIMKKQVNLTLRSDIDYTSQNQRLRELIGEMEHKIANFGLTANRLSYPETGNNSQAKQNVLPEKK